MKHKDKLMPDSPKPVSASPEMIPMQAPVIREQPVFAPDSGHRTVMTAKRTKNRDPNGLNQHVQIEWEDIIGEPEGTQSPYCVWWLSRWGFRITRDVCYTTLSVLIAPPCALLLGFGFACLAFEQIWCIAPCMRCLKVYYAVIRTVVVSCMAACIVPTADAVGRVFRHIRVNVRKEAPDDKDVLFI